VVEEGMGATPVDLECSTDRQQACRFYLDLGIEGLSARNFTVQELKAALWDLFQAGTTGSKAVLVTRLLKLCKVQMDKYIEEGAAPESQGASAKRRDQHDSIEGGDAKARKVEDLVEDAYGLDSSDDEQACAPASASGIDALETQNCNLHTMYVDVEEF
jgi:hypothetical protein